MTYFLPWMQLIIAAIIILFSSTYLAKSADVIALKTGLGRTFVGVVLLATATSLPELATGINAVATLNAPNLAGGDVFGSNIFNLLIIVVLDTYWRNGTFLGSVYNNTWLIAVLSISIISIAVIALWNPLQINVGIGHIGLFSYILLIFFGLSMFILYQQGKKGEKSQETHEESHDQDKSYTLKKSFIIYGISASIIIISAIFLSRAGEEIAEIMHWGESFVGTQLLALSTSLPELATSIAAVRLRAPELAITNLLGSNLFNTGIVLFADDAFYMNGSIWDAFSNAHILNLGIAILMTCIVFTTILLKPKRKLLKYFGIESVLLVACYLIATIYTFQNP